MMRSGKSLSPIVSVVIPTLQQRYLYECLHGLCRQTARAFEVIVVENGERSDTQKLVAEYKSALDIRYHYEPVTGGNRARNLGAQFACGNVIAFLDDDCAPKENWIEALVKNPDLQKSNTILGGKVVLDFTTPPPDWFTGVFTESLSAIDLGAVRRPLRGSEYIVSANMAMSKQTFKQLGGFAPNIGIRGKSSLQLGNDEIELLHRCVSRGGEVLYDPELCVNHLIPSERIDMRRLALRRYGQGMSDVHLEQHLSTKPLHADNDRFRFAQSLCAGKSGHIWLKNMVSQRDMLTLKNQFDFDRNSRVLRLSYLYGLMHGVEMLASGICDASYHDPAEANLAENDQTQHDFFWSQRLQSMNIFCNNQWLSEWTESELKLTMTGARHKHD